MRGPGRREIGHGGLAEARSFRCMPVEETFPYTIRIVSDILGVERLLVAWPPSAAARLALMDAGVPIKAPVAGIAMGLHQGRRQRAVLTDILGDEDHLGDMDFKVAGTAKGITALQMDIKIDGINEQISPQGAPAGQGRQVLPSSTR